LKKIRLLTLASLAVENQLTYSSIVQALKIDNSEVERWVISAINAGLIEAKMDQLKEVILIKRGAQRVFTITEWKQLSDHLHAWRDNVRSLLQVVKEAQRDGM